MLITNLIPDIYKLIGSKQEGWFDDQLAQALSADITNRLRASLGGQNHSRRPTLRLSQMGPRCPRALWYSIHHPELAEALPPWAEIKYAFGHVIEALAISLARAAGHEVTGEQDELTLDDVRGHRDCVIDGCVVDVKSASSISFSKFKTLDYSIYDNFGYLDQLDGYVVASLDDPLVRVKDKGYLLAIDKQLGHMALYEHRVRENSIRERIKYYREIVGRSSPPPCECKSIKDGESGNLKLDLKASYNAFKHSCFPNLRTFLYVGGPRFLSTVKRKPDVPEIDRYGKTVYN